MLQTSPGSWVANDRDLGRRARPGTSVGGVIIEPTEIEGLYTIEQERHADERGFFARTWCINELAEAGLAVEFVQASISHNTTSGTLRGLHFQEDPYGETKLIGCVNGALHDVLLDLRPDSDTYLRHLSFELTPDRGLSLLACPGLAHGFQTLADDTVVSYHIDTFYQPAHATGVRWDDPAFAIEWPDVEVRIMSEKDREWPDFSPAAPV